MSLRRLGFWAALIFMLVSVGQIHEMIPGLKYFKLGSLTTIILYVGVVLELRNLKWSPMIFWRVLFFLSLLPGIYFGFDRGIVLQTTKEEFVMVFAFFLGAIIFFRTIEDFRKIQMSFIWLAVPLSLWALSHNGRGPGMLGDENDIALMLVMLLPFPFFKLFEKMSPRAFVMYLGIFFTILAGIAATISRGGMVGSMVVLGGCWLKSRYKTSTMVIMVLLLVAVVALGPDKLVSEFESISDTHETTADQRIYYWGVSWEMFQQRPVFGVGAKAWGSAVWSGLVSRHGRGFHNMTPHSIYFQLLSELGAFGVITWLGVLVCCGFCFRAILPGRLREQASAAMLNNLSPTFVHEVQERQKFMSNFGVALGVGMLGYLASGAFLSFVFYPMFTTFAALLQASRDTWDRELQILKFINRGGDAPSVPSST